MTSRQGVEASYDVIRGHPPHRTPSGGPDELRVAVEACPTMLCADDVPSILTHPVMKSLASEGPDRLTKLVVFGVVPVESADIVGVADERVRDVVHAVAWSTDECDGRHGGLGESDTDDLIQHEAACVFGQVVQCELDSTGAIDFETLAGVIADRAGHTGRIAGERAFVQQLRIEVRYVFGRRQARIDVDFLVQIDQVAMHTVAYCSDDLDGSCAKWRVCHCPHPLSRCLLVKCLRIAEHTYYIVFWKYSQFYTIVLELLIVGAFSHKR